MDVTLSPILEVVHNLNQDDPSEPSNKSNTTPTDLPEDPLQEEGERSSVATTLADQGTTAMLETFITSYVIESVSTPSQYTDAWATKGTTMSGEDINDNVSEISESTGSVATAASGYYCTLSGKFTSIPVMPSLWKIQNVDDSAFDH
eukprot:1953626-Ditylum_brightwellii.AAC.1